MKIERTKGEFGLLKYDETCKKLYVYCETNAISYNFGIIHIGRAVEYN